MIVKSCFILLTALSGNKAVISVNNISNIRVQFDKTYVTSTSNTDVGVKETPEEIQNILINKKLPSFVCVGGT